MDGGGGGEVRLCVAILAFTFSCFFSMASSDSTTKIDQWVKNLDRSQLLEFLGVDDSFEQVGDIEAIRAISASTVNPVVIYKSDVPFLNKIDADCSSGAIIIRRFKNATVDIPCYSQELDEGSKFCDVCNEIWQEPDTRGFFRLDAETMPNAAEFYAQGVLWKLPFMEHMEQFFSDEIEVVKKIFDGTESEFPIEWPNTSFESVASQILLRSGVLHRDADKSRNPYRRDQWEHSRIAEYLRDMIGCWLRIRTTIDADELSREVKARHRTAKSVGLASMWRVQRAHRKVPILVGPLVPADIMLAGFRAGCAGFKVLVNNVNAESDSDIQYVPEFQWGDNVEVVREWASHVTLPVFRRPARKSAPKYVSPSQSPAKSKSNSDKIKDKGNPHSPSSTNIWYAAKGTSRTGVYSYKHVADSYVMNGTGTVKKFKSLAKARDWLEMPGARTFYEQTGHQTAVKSEVGSEADEFFAVKGSSKAGVYVTMADAIQAKSEGGGTFGVFVSEAQAQEFATSADRFVVWAGRKVGIMSKAECIESTQRLSKAKIKGIDVKKRTRRRKRSSITRSPLARFLEFTTIGVRRSAR